MSNATPFVAAGHLYAPPFWRTGRTTPLDLFYGLCMLSVAAAFVLYFILWKYKILMFGWILCIALLTIFWAIGEARIRLSAKVCWPLFAFYLYIWLSALWSFDRNVTLLWAAIDLVYPAIFLLALIWAHNIDAWRLSSFFEISAALNTLVGLYFIATTGSIINWSYGAVRSGFGFVFVTALPFLAWRLKERPSLYRAALVGWCIVAIPFTGARIALAALPLALIACAVVVVRSSRRPVYASVVTTALGIVAVAIALAWPQVRTGIGDTLKRFSSGRTLNVASVVNEVDLPAGQRVDFERRLQAFVALQTFIEHPMLGDGYMNTLAKTTQRFRYPVTAHGLPFTLLAETGILGTVLFGLLLLPFFRGLRAARRRATTLSERGFISASFFTMILMLLYGMFHQLHQIAAFFVVLGWGYAYLQDRGAMRVAAHRTN